jgi:ABC-type polysaccharide/polyol phosphate transport system ATPase subunit
VIFTLIAFNNSPFTSHDSRSLSLAGLKANQLDSNGAILGMSKWEIKKKFDEIVAFAEIEKFLDTPVKRYSSLNAIIE